MNGFLSAILSLAANTYSHYCPLVLSHSALVHIGGKCVLSSAEGGAVKMNEMKEIVKSAS